MKKVNQLLIYTNSNRLLVENAKNLLVNADIEIHVKNEYLSAGAGDLAPGDTWLELWLVNPQKNEKAARAILQPLGDDEEADDWFCESCGEKNYPAFNLCWNCQHRC